MPGACVGVDGSLISTTQELVLARPENIEGADDPDFMLEVQQASVQMAGHSRLEQIRASMRGDALPAGGAAAPATPATSASTPEPEQPLGQ